MKHTNVVAVVLLGSVFSAYCGAQSLSGGLGLVVYPGEGQSSSQQAKDEGECYGWAKNTTGVDPANPAAGVQQQAAAAPPPGGQAAAGAMRGAAGAALIGNIADEDAGEFAAAGALIGGARGARRAKEQQAQAQQQAAANNQAAVQQRMQLFGNAFGACMEGRKYTVK